VTHQGFSFNPLHFQQPHTTWVSKKDPIHNEVPLTQDGCQNMACYNWQGKVDLHFHLPTVCSNLLLIRACIVLQVKECLGHPNSISNQDSEKL
jgi:hypothetical protein